MTLLQNCLPSTESHSDVKVIVTRQSKAYTNPFSIVDMLLTSFIQLGSSTTLMLSTPFIILLLLLYYYCKYNNEFTTSKNKFEDDRRHRRFCAWLFNFIIYLHVVFLCWDFVN